jgi:hypothetical protein
MWPFLVMGGIGVTCVVYSQYRQYRQRKWDFFTEALLLELDEINRDCPQTNTWTAAQIRKNSTADLIRILHSM